MASLTQVSITIRKAVRYGIYLLVFLIIGKISFDLGLKVFRYFFPKPPPPPTVSYGKLPKLSFPDRPKVNLSFTLETPEGSLPKLPVQAKVYFMPKISASLLSLDGAKQKAGGLGFNPDAPQEISQTTYRFPHKAVASNFEINIVTGTFSISYNLDADSSLLQRKPPPPEVAASYIRSFLSSADLLPSDLTGATTSEFLKPEGGKFIPAISLSDANTVKINFFRKNYDNLPSITSTPSEGNVWFLVSGETEKGEQVFAGESHYFPVDENQFSTYPIKTPDTAWQELNSPNAFIASLGVNKEGENIKIRRVYLAYFDAPVPMQFFQPIYVFEGDRGFMVYVPAVTPDYYGE